MVNKVKKYQVQRKVKRIILDILMQAARGG